MSRRTAHLFTPLKLGAVEFRNRIAVSPMCQYSAHDGCADPDWHGQHLTQFAFSGAGLVMVEATAVERRGRITHGCLGLYDDATEQALARVLAAAKRFAVPGTRFGIQLAHAGRKASTQRPWEGGSTLPAGADPWPIVAASPIPFAEGWSVPAALDADGMTSVKEAFVAAAKRALRLGFDVVELHAAHGYLVHTFLSPLSNQRTDGYGGSPAGRMRFPLELVSAMRAVLPPERVAFGARITGTDWADAGLNVEDAVAFASELDAAGVDYVCVSSGGIEPGIHVPVAPGYQLPLARRVKQSTGLVTRAVGLIADAAQAEAVIAAGDADMVAMARALLDDPRWVWHAAERLGADVVYPPQYARAQARLWPGAGIARPAASTRDAR